MKISNSHIFFFIYLTALFLTGCKKLERDNPLDLNSSNSETVVNFSRFVVSEDNNYDQQINKGESIKLQIYLKNNGTSTANNVKGTISCASSYISALTPTTATGYYQNGNSYYDYIESGKEGFNEYSDLSFNVSSNTPVGTVITFNISITDEANNTWSDSFTITVVGTGASLGFSRFDVREDNNDDQQINKGESIKLQIYLKNNGTSTANNVKGTISCASSYISALTPTTATGYYQNGNSYYDYIESGKEGFNAYSYLNFNVSSSTPTGSIISFSLLITDESNNSWSDTFTITVY